jgi:hypothetical protein
MRCVVQAPRRGSDSIPSAIAGVPRCLNFVRRSEINRFRGRLRGLSPEQENEGGVLTSRIVNRFLEGPIRLPRCHQGKSDLFSKTLQTLFPFKEISRPGDL